MRTALIILGKVLRVQNGVKYHLTASIKNKERACLNEFMRRLL